MNNYVKKFIFMMLGSAVMGIGIGIALTGGQGVDPFSLFWEGLTNVFPITIGQANLITNAFLLVVVVLIDRKQLNVGTILNPLILGVFTDFVMKAMTQPARFELQVAYSIVGVILLGVGIGIYSAANIGKGPYDAFSFSITKLFNLNFVYVRIAIDAIFFVIGFALGARVGVAALVAVFMMGKIIAVTNKTFHRIITPGVQEI